VKAHQFATQEAARSLNLSDLRQQASQLVDSARSEAEQLLAQARQTVSQVGEAARSAARQEGLQQGLQDADAQIAAKSEQRAQALVAERMAALLPLWNSWLEQFQAEQQRWIVDWEQQGIKLSLAIAEKLTFRQFEIDPNAARDAIRETLHFVAGHKSVRVTMNSRDLEAFAPHIEQSVARAAGVLEAVVVEDDTIAPGGCRLETINGEIDATIPTMIERIAEELDCSLT
jgi:flagellar assembly protein FliH